VHRLYKDVADTAAELSEEIGSTRAEPSIYRQRVLDYLRGDGSVVLAKMIDDELEIGFTLEETVRIHWDSFEEIVRKHQASH